MGTTKAKLGDWVEVPVKPLSVNAAYRGRRFKTSDYSKYIKEVQSVLPDLPTIPERTRLQLSIIVYYSNAANDIDNCIKPFLDILQKQYSFNDKWVYELRVTKVLVEKGEEQISFNLKELL